MQRLMSGVSNARPHIFDILHHRKEPGFILVLPLYISSPTSIPGLCPQSSTSKSSLDRHSEICN